MTIYTLDFSKCFTIEYQGFFRYHEIRKQYGLDTYCIVFDQWIEVIENNLLILSYNTKTDLFYTFKQNGMVYGTKTSNTEEVFWETWKPIAFKSQMKNFLDI
jgi:hypothetical protein